MDVVHYIRSLQFGSSAFLVSYIGCTIASGSPTLSGEQLGFARLVGLVSLSKAACLQSGSRVRNLSSREQIHLDTDSTIATSLPSTIVKLLVCFTILLLTCFTVLLRCWLASQSCCGCWSASQSCRATGLRHSLATGLLRSFAAPLVCFTVLLRC